MARLSAPVKPSEYCLVFPFPNSLIKTPKNEIKGGRNFWRKIFV